MILPLFIPKDNIDEYLNNNFNLAIFDSLAQFESQEEGINRLVLFNRLYEQYGIIEANKSKPNSTITHLLKLDLPEHHLYLLFVLLVVLIDAVHEEATNDLQDNSMHICKALIVKEANTIYRNFPPAAPDLDAPEVPMIPEGYYWMEGELEKLPDFKSKMTFLLKAKAEYLRKANAFVLGNTSEEVPPNEVYDLEMNLLKSLEELKASAGITAKPVVDEPIENTIEEEVSNNTIQDEEILEPPFPDPKLHQTRKSIEAEFDLMHKNQRWEYAFTYESDYNTFVEILVKFFEAQPYEIPRKILRLKNDTKSRVGRVLRNLHKDLKFDGLNLREDKDFFKIIRVLNHFELLDDISVYNAITK